MARRGYDDGYGDQWSPVPDIVKQFVHFFYRHIRYQQKWPQAKMCALKSLLGSMFFCTMLACPAWSFQGAPFSRSLTAGGRIFACGECWQLQW